MLSTQVRFYGIALRGETENAGKSASHSAKSTAHRTPMAARGAFGYSTTIETRTAHTRSQS
jgi:hypothetical protein